MPISAVLNNSSCITRLSKSTFIKLCSHLRRQCLAGSHPTSDGGRRQPDQQATAVRLRRGQGVCGRRGGGPELHHAHDR